MSLVSASFSLSVAHGLGAVDQSPKKIFIETIAPVPRASREEQKILQVIRDEVEAARRHPGWEGREIPLAQDGRGNMVARLPGTGRFRHAPIVTGVQGHVDMVALGGSAIHGVEVAETNGWMHSRGKKTTLGADNGLAIAIMIALLRQPSIEHGPLELIFTVAEEVGLEGVREFDLPLEATLVINLDSEEECTAAYACIGSRRTLVERKIALQAAPNKFKALRFKIVDLPAGHSGVQIHEARPNAAIYGAGLLQRLIEDHPELRVTGLEVGAQNRLNTIPGEFEATILFPPHRQTAIRRRLKSLEREARRSTPGAETSRLKMKVVHGEAARVISNDTAVYILQFLQNIPNGVLIRDPVHPSGVRTSSNLGWVSLKEDSFKFGWMLRSWDNPEAELTEARLNRFVDENLAKTVPVSSGMVAASPAWWTDPKAWPFVVAQEVDPNTRLVAVPEGLEIAFLPLKFPGTMAISMGSNIRGPHSLEEEAESSSLERFFNYFLRYLIAVADCQVNLTTPPVPEAG